MIRSRHPCVNTYGRATFGPQRSPPVHTVQRKVNLWTRRRKTRARRAPHRARAATRCTPLRTRRRAPLRATARHQHTRSDQVRAGGRSGRGHRPRDAGARRGSRPLRCRGMVRPAAKLPAQGRSGAGRPVSRAHSPATAHLPLSGRPIACATARAPTAPLADHMVCGARSRQLTQTADISSHYTGAPSLYTRWPQHAPGVAISWSRH